MMKLFELPEDEKIKTKYRCKHCEHFFTHQYSKKLCYCNIKSQKNTAYGKMKVKRNDNQCEDFKLKESE